jgi:hypothetical protein
VNSRKVKHKILNFYNNVFKTVYKISLEIHVPPIFVLSVNDIVTEAPLLASTADKTPGAGRLAPYAKTFIETIVAVTPSGQDAGELDATVILNRPEVLAMI